MKNNVLPEENAPCCEEHVIHKDRAEKAISHMPDEDRILSLAEFFKIFGDVSRIRILFILLDNELCVCDIAESLSVSISAVSHQLKILKAAKLVKYRKEGKSCFYSLADDHVKSILSQGMEHICE